MFDGAGRTLEKATIVVENDKIAMVEEGVRSSHTASATVINAEGKTVLPGLIDSHVHLGSDPTELNWQLAYLKQPLIPHGLLSLFAYRNAVDCLRAGFTTLRNIENPGENAGVPLRQAIQMGIVSGPRILTSGTIAATGSTIDFDKPVSLRRSPGELADGEDEVRRQVRKRVREGVDFIKTFAYGGIQDMMQPKRRLARCYTEPELVAMVDEAHAHGLKVAAHVEASEGIEMCINSGVDSIEHGFLLKDENIRAMASKGTFLVPTLSPVERLAHGNVEGSNADVTKSYTAIWRHFEEYFPHCIRAGVKIAMGTDTWREVSAVKFGGNAYELELLVRLGMTEAQALTSATGTAAELLGIDEVVGLLAPGKLADIVVVDGNPLRDITVLQHRDKIAYVLKDGKIVSSTPS